jgi:hypothetical protein
VLDHGAKVVISFDETRVVVLHFGHVVAEEGDDVTLAISLEKSLILLLETTSAEKELIVIRHDDEGLTGWSLGVKRDR